MKIGILTFHRAVNYGAFLQCFALKRCLENMGHIVKVIDYWPTPHVEFYKTFSLTYVKGYINHPFTLIKYIVLAMFKGRREMVRFSKMHELQYSHFGISRKVQYTRGEDISFSGLGTIIYGSDQIWWKSNMLNYNYYDSVYWGGYADKSINKVSYAASMGMTPNDNVDSAFFTQGLENFDSISVREQYAKDFLQHFTNKSIEVVIDPVFLLRKEDWENIICDLKNNQEDYVLYYSVITSKKARDFALNLAHKHNIRFVEVSARIKPFCYEKNVLQTEDAFEFLVLLRNAKYVVSTSFHGTAFSIIFEKEFYALGMGEKGGRVTSLLDSLNLSDHYLSDVNCQPNKIDYNIVKPLLKSHVDKSVEFLKKTVHDKL